MNPNLSKLEPYPFHKLALLKKGLSPPPETTHIALSLGEPAHPAPDFIADVVAANLDGLSRYPSTRGSDELRAAIAAWLNRRYRLPSGSIDAQRHVLPVNGTREALFAFAQCVVDSASKPLVAVPNPFYQIYEGAALLAGATPYFLNCTRANDYLPDLDAVPESIWQRCGLVYLCSPGNPTGRVLPAEFMLRLLALADRHDFVIASDECYSEIYPDEDRPPPGLLQVCAEAGREDFARCMVFNSLSKRSSVPGLRSGLIAGDAELVDAFLAYRTYQGGAMSLTVQAVSAAAWNDEAHVRNNRELYRRKFSAVLALLAARSALSVAAPDAGFFLWPELPGDDTAFARELFTRHNVTVLPGSYLARTAHQTNPGAGHARIALVAPLEACVEAAERLCEFVSGRAPGER